MERNTILQTHFIVFQGYFDILYLHHNKYIPKCYKVQKLIKKRRKKLSSGFGMELFIYIYIYIYILLLLLLYIYILLYSL